MIQWNSKVKSLSWLALMLMYNDKMLCAYKKDSFHVTWFPFMKIVAFAVWKFHILYRTTQLKRMLRKMQTKMTPKQIVLLFLTILLGAIVCLFDRITFSCRKLDEDEMINPKWKWVNTIGDLLFSWLQISDSPKNIPNSSSKILLLKGF